MRYCLGKRPARPDAIKLKFGAVFNASALPVPPAVFGHERIGVPWQVFSNDKFGDCVWAGAAHETMVWTREGSGVPAIFNDSGVLSDYAAVTGFDPDRPDTDQGTDVQAAASYRRKTGIVDAFGHRHLIFAYSALEAGNVDDVILAAYLTGAVGIGLELPDTAIDQFDKGVPWSIVPGAKVEGGHYVPIVGRNSRGDLLCLTWGRLHAMTVPFLAACMDEGICCISDEMLNKQGLTPEQFARNDVVKYIAALGS